MQSKKVLTRREAIPLIGLVLAGCGGGGGGSSPAPVQPPPSQPPPTSPPQPNQTVTVVINGSIRTVTLPHPNATVLELTRIASTSVEMEGERVITINGLRDTKVPGTPHWRYYRESELVLLPAASATVRSSSTLEWKHEITGE